MRKMNKDTYTVARFSRQVTADAQIAEGEIMYMRGEGSITPENNPFNVFTGNYDDRITSNAITKQTFPAWDDSQSEIASDWVFYSDNDNYYRWYEGRGMSPFKGFGRSSYNNILLTYIAENEGLVENELRTSPICWDEISKLNNVVSGVSMVNELKVNLFDLENTTPLAEQRYAYNFSGNSGARLVNGYNSLDQAYFHITKSQQLEVTIQDFADKGSVAGAGIQTLTVGKGQEITVPAITNQGDETFAYSMEVFITAYPITTTALIGDTTTDYWTTIDSSGLLVMSAPKENGSSSDKLIKTTVPIPLNTWTRVTISQDVPLFFDNSYSIVLLDVDANAQLEQVSTTIYNDFDPLSINKIVNPDIFTGRIRNVEIFQYDSNYEKIPLHFWALDEGLVTDPAEDSVGTLDGTRVNMTQDDIIPDGGSVPVSTERTIFDADPIFGGGVDPDDDTKRIHLAISDQNLLISETPAAIETITINDVEYQLGDLLEPLDEDTKYHIVVKPSKDVQITYLGEHRDGVKYFSGFMYDLKMVDDCYEIEYAFNNYAMVGQRRTPNKTHIFTIRGGYTLNNWKLINK